MLTHRTFGWCAGTYQKIAGTRLLHPYDGAIGERDEKNDCSTALIDNFFTLTAADEFNNKNHIEHSSL